MKLIIGLGNPDKAYQSTRHNVGQMAVVALQQKFSGSLPAFSPQHKLLAEISQGKLSSHSLILAKPLTYMNESGQAAVLLKNYFQVNLPDIWIIHDELDLPLGRIKISQGASAAGHKGVESIIAALNSKDFIRFRIGIGKPPSPQDPRKWVLQPFAPAEKNILNQAIEFAISALLTALEKGIKTTQSQYNQKNSLR